MVVDNKLWRDLVLVGGGHSHVLALRMLAMQAIEGLRITLISPASHTPYSGMLPGLVAGHYTFEQSHIDLQRLCQWAGARFITGQVTGIDLTAKRLTLAGRPPVDYDVVSIDIGSEPELDQVPGALEYATPVKPVATLWQRWQSLEQRIDTNEVSDQHRIGMVGGGAGSVELVLAMAHQLQDKPVTFDLWCGAPRILPEYNPRARRAALAALQRYNVAVHCNARVTRVTAGELLLADGATAPYDELYWCTGAAAAPWIAASGLATDNHGFLAVRDTLQSLHDDRVFAAGDIATQVNYPRPKAGVYAVRQGPVLAKNLRAFLLRKPLREHRPQRGFLSLLSLGDKRATADKALFSATGGWVWRWKDRIDRKFMARFQTLPENMPRVARRRLWKSKSKPGPAFCGGCGAKVGADALSAVLSQLRREYPDYCAVGADDAVAIPAPNGMVIVQSLDMLRQLISDPWVMGRIAANHALSDLYACGARPVSALAALTLPFASTVVLQRELKSLLGGALYEFAAADCRLTGGHSMQGPELNIGFVVNGIPIADDGTLLGKSGAAPGDCLVLTKPLGTGTLFAAHMQHKADGRDISNAVNAMLQSNGMAAELAIAHGASACTDITGFGLLGHLLEMLAGDCGARLHLAQLPLLRGAVKQVAAGIVSTMHAANVRNASWSLQLPRGADQARFQLLFDPQTSGGLLIAVPPARVADLCSALRESGYSSAAMVGEVTARAQGTQFPIVIA